jgi:ribosomal protein S20
MARSVSGVPLPPSGAPTASHAIASRPLTRRALTRDSAPMRMTGEEQEQRNRDTRSVVARDVIKMYRKAVDHATRNDIAAAAAAHHELGRDYDSAVAEGLIERIGAEIDQRVDARLGAVSRGSGPAAEVSQASARQQAMWTGAAVGAGMTGIVVLIVNARHATTDLIASVITVWVIIAIAALATTLARRYRNPRHE